MKKTLTLIIFILTLAVTSNVFGQFAEKAPESDYGEIWITTNKPAEFPGGMSKFYGYLNKKLKCSARKANTKRVMVQFIVDSTGYVRQGSVKFVDSKYINNQTIRGQISSKCSEELTSIFENSPKWNAGYVTELDKSVAVKYAFPVSFK